MNVTSEEHTYPSVIILTSNVNMAFSSSSTNRYQMGKDQDTDINMTDFVDNSNSKGKNARKKVNENKRKRKRCTETNREMREDSKRRKYDAEIDNVKDELVSYVTDGIELIKNLKGSEYNIMLRKIEIQKLTSRNQTQTIGKQTQTIEEQRKKIEELELIIDTMIEKVRDQSVKNGRQQLQYNALLNENEAMQQKIDVLEYEYEDMRESERYQLGENKRLIRQVEERDQTIKELNTKVNGIKLFESKVFALFTEQGFSQYTIEPDKNNEISEMDENNNMDESE